MGSSRTFIILAVLLAVLAGGCTQTATSTPAAAATTAPTAAAKAAATTAPATTTAATAATPAAAATAARTAGPLTKVTMMLDWVPNTNHTGLYVALDKGYYREAGLDVSIVEPAQAGVEQVVAAGQAEFGISAQELLTGARVEGVPIVSVAAIIQHNTSGFASPKSKAITRPKDFEGKSYGAFGAPIEKAVLDALMTCDGGDVNKVKFVDIGSTDFFVATQRDIDFAWIFQGWTGIEAELRGVPLNYVALQDWTRCVPDYYTPVLITGEKTIAEKPDVVRKFVEAMSRGYRFAIDQPDEAAAILSKRSPESNPDLVKRSQKWLSPRYAEGTARWGEQKLEVWQRFGDWLADKGLVAKKIDASKAFTNDFLPK